MKIINLNSEIEITPSEQSFLEEILQTCDHLYRHPEHNLNQLARMVPVFLVNEDRMDSFETSDFKEQPREGWHEGSRPPTEWLGYYTRGGKGLFLDMPMVVVCPCRILSCVGNDQEYTFLLAKVIIHEFLHARFDSDNQNGGYGKFDEFYAWMEESLVNWCTLEYIEEYCSRTIFLRTRHYGGMSSWLTSFGDFVTEFVRNQPPNYALGYELWQNRLFHDWEWERSKNNKLAAGQRHSEKEEWLNYMKVHYHQVDPQKGKYLYDQLFKGRDKAKQDRAKARLEEKIKNDVNATVFPRLFAAEVMPS